MTLLNCTNNTYTTTIQARAANVTSLSIGNSSVFFTYNPAALSFVGYQAANFNAFPWDVQTFDGNSPGIINVTLTLLQNSNSTPAITSGGWIDVGTATFTVVSPTANPQLAFSSDPSFTNFNSVPANDGSNPIQNGTFTGVSAPGVLTCPVCSLTVVPLLTTSSTTLCEASSATLTVTCQTGTPRWNTGATTTSIIVQPATTTVYTAVCQSSSACQTPPASVIITVFPRPTVGPSQTLVCVNGAVPTSTTLTAQTNSSVLTGQWYAQPGNPNATTFANATSLNTTVSGLLPGRTYQFVWANSPSGCADGLTITTSTCPTVSLGSIGDFVWKDLNGNGIQDSGEPPIPGLTVTLLQSGSAITTAITSTSGLYSFTGLTPGVPYSVSFTTPPGYTATTPTAPGSTTANDSNPINGITASVTLAPGEHNPTLDAGFIPPCNLTVTAQATSNTLCTGQNATVFATVTPAGSYTYAWTAPAGVILTGGSSATASASVMNTGVNTFTVTVSSSPTCRTTATVSITVTIPAPPVISASPTTICAGSSSMLMANCATGTPRWNTGETTTMIDVILGTTTVYTAVCQSSTACQSMPASVTVVVNPKPTVGASQTLIQCVQGVASNSTTLMAQTNSAVQTGQWFPQGGNPNATTLANANSLTTTVSGLQPGRSYTYVWANTSGCTEALVVTVQPCSCTVNVATQVNPASGSICTGGAFALTASATPAGSYTYSWAAPSGIALTGATSATASTGPMNTAGVYTFTVTVSASPVCFTTATVAVTVAQPAAFTASSATVCSSLPLSFTSFVQMGNNTTYSVYNSLADAQGDVNRLNPQQSFTVGTTTVYYIRGRELTSNCTGIQSMTLTPISCGTAPIVDLRFATLLNCTNNTYTTTIQARAANVTSLLIGNSSVFITYNPAALSFVTYQAANFNAFPWDVQTFDGNSPGIINVTLTLLQSNSSTPAITSGGWIDIGTATFTVVSGTANPQLAFNSDPSFTNFNSVPANDGSNPIQNGTFTGVSAPGSLSCAPAPLGSIGDFVWKDLNSNGIQDDGANSGISDVPVSLLKETSPGQFSVVATTTTSQAGLYSFTGLTAGNYKVRVDVEAVPFYCEPTTQTVVTTNDATNSKINPQGETPLIVIDPNNPNLKDYPKADAGFKPVPLGSLGDYVWKDTNNDGIQNETNTGAANIGLKLLNSDGVYVIRGVLSGSQEVPAVPTSGTGLIYGTFNPANNTLMLVTGFSNLSGTVSMAHIHTGVAGVNGPVAVDLVPAGFPTGVRTGNAVTNTVLTAAQRDLLMSNKLYVNVHTSTNGGGEVRAQLMACEFTNSSGNYLFTNLPEDTYTVAVDTKTIPATCVISSKQNSTSATEATDSDFNPATGISDPVMVNPNNQATRDIRTVDLALVSSQTGTPALSLIKRVSKTRAKVGDVLTYTLIVTNTGNGAASGVVVSDTYTSALTFVAGSTNASSGTFTPSSMGGTWNIASLPAGATATLTYSLSVVREGVLRNAASLGNEVVVNTCTTAPILVCQGQPFAFKFTAPTGHSRYQWYRTTSAGVVLVSDVTATSANAATANSYTATLVGEYQVVLNEGVSGSCVDGSCCPIIIEEGPGIVPPGIATQTASCTSVTAATANSDARIILSTTALSGQTYNIAKGSSFTASAPLFSSAQVLPTQIGSVLASGLPSPGTIAGDLYTVRIYQGDCFVDVVVTLQQTNCACTEIKCLPITIRKTKSGVKSLQIR